MRQWYTTPLSPTSAAPTRQPCPAPAAGRRRRYDFTGGATLLYAVPTRPGWSRAFIADLATPAAASGPQAAAARRRRWPLLLRLLLLVSARFPFLQHITARGGVLDGDTYFLHVQVSPAVPPPSSGGATHQLGRAEGGVLVAELIAKLPHRPTPPPQERYLKSTADAAASWRQQYYLPWSTDAPVVALRQWLERHGGGQAPGSARCAAELPPELPKEAVLDRWGQHTSTCSTCLKVSSRARQAAAGKQLTIYAWAAGVCMYC
jgi:pheophorbide a oxygenase